MAAFTANQVTINNGQTGVLINSGENPQQVQYGDFLVVGDFSPAQINRTYTNENNQPVIELVRPWRNSNQLNQPAIVIPTTVNFRDTVKALQNANLLINDNMQAMSDWQSKTGSVTFIGLDGTERTVPTLASFLATVGTAATRDVVTSATDDTTGAVITVGHGGTGSVSMNLEDAFESGISGFARCSSTTTNLPLATVYNWAGIRLNGFNSNNGIRMISPLTSSFSRFFLNVKAGNNDNGWVEMYHSGNSVNPLDYGLGSQSAISSFADYNQINAGGFGFFVPTSEGNPLGSSISVLNMPSNVGNSSYRIIGRYVTNQNKIYVESVNAGVSRGVDEILHTGNSNLDDFHSDEVAGNLIAVGEAVSPTILRFYLPLNSKTRPIGITVTSTFSAYKQGGLVISATNQITLNAGLSSPKVGVLEISGSGFTTGDNINLRASTTTSSIRFNF